MRLIAQSTSKSAPEGVKSPMAKFTRIVIQLPLDLKLKLDKLKLQGYTTSGFIRAVLERELSKPNHMANDEEPGNSQPNGGDSR
jgi:hypothetical protein